jgi:hypothetical protein
MNQKPGTAVAKETNHVGKTKENNRQRTTDNKQLTKNL